MKTKESKAAQRLSRVKTNLKNAGGVTGVLALASASAAVSAADHTTEINAAYTDGNTNVGAAVAGVIALVAVVTGLGLIVSILRR